MSAAAAAYPLTPGLPFRFSFKNHFLSGITLPAFIRLIRRHWDVVDWMLYGHRVLFLLCMAGVNSLLGLLDSLLYRRAISAQPLHPEPVIILGHPRTGTTHVHNMLAVDEQFAYARTFHAGFPACFASCGRLKPLLAPLVDATRPMDNMPLTLDTPCEDEIAASALTGTVSAYLPLVFMRDRHRFDAFYTFEGASEADFDSWRSSLLWFLKKVTLCWGGCKPLLIKSPVHTARVALLLKLFPRAKFVYVHRDPLTTFASAAHMADTYYWHCALQRTTSGDVTDFILNQFDLLYRTYSADRKLIPAGNLVEVSFAELDADPLAAMQRIYSSLRLGRFEDVRPALERYCGGIELSGFKKNAHRPLSRELRRRVQQRWAPFYREYGYPLDPSLTRELEELPAIGDKLISA